MRCPPSASLDWSDRPGHAGRAVASGVQSPWLWPVQGAEVVVNYASSPAAAAEAVVADDPGHWGLRLCPPGRTYRR